MSRRVQNWVCKQEKSSSTLVEKARHEEEGNPTPRNTIINNQGKGFRMKSTRGVILNSSTQTAASQILNKGSNIWMPRGQRRNLYSLKHLGEVVSNTTLFKLGVWFGYSSLNKEALSD